MKLNYNRFKYLVRERLVLNTLLEANDPKKKKPPGLKELKDIWEKQGKTFVCPRHGLPLETKWQRIKMNEFDPDDPQRTATLKSYNQMMPATAIAQKDKKLHYLKKIAIVHKLIPQHFFCPLTKQPANESTEEREFRPFVDKEGNDLTAEFETVKKKLGQEVKRLGLTKPDKDQLSDEGRKLLDRYIKLKTFKASTKNREAYPVWEVERDEEGKAIIDPTTKKPVMKQETMQCDYIVGGKWQKPGQISRDAWLREFEEEPSSYRAFGTVAQEEEATGNLKRSSPRRSKEHIEAGNANTRPETAPDPLVAKIYDMAKKGYHYDYVRQDEAAEKVYEFIKKNNVTGVKGIGFSDDGRSIEVVLAVSFEKIAARAAKEPENAKLASLYKKLLKLQSMRAGNVPIVFTDSTNTDSKKLLSVQDLGKNDENFAKELKTMYGNIQQARKFGAKGQLVKVELQKSPEGKPIFTSRDAWYLSTIWPQKLRAIKDKAGENFKGQEPYVGVTSAMVIQLLNNMGWEQAGSKNHGITASDEESYDVSDETDAKSKATQSWSGIGFRPAARRNKDEKENKPTWSSATDSVVMDVGTASEDSLQARINNAYKELDQAEQEELDSLQGPKQFPDAPGEMKAIKKRKEAAKEKLDMLLSLKSEDDMDDITYAKREVEDAKKLVRIAYTRNDKRDIEAALEKLQKAEKELQDYEELENSAALRKRVDMGVDTEFDDFDDLDTAQSSEEDESEDDLISDLDITSDEDDEEEKK